ncbi:hypothetical protein HIM_01116 [Hirsutella minnesotensis 3608]|nr:hypothetical protein HIM_01116 [Hirsutella minnesotensis 3608]
MGLLNERATWDSDSEGDASDVERQPSFSKLPLAEYTSSVGSWFFSTSWRLLTLRLLTFLTPSFLQGRHAREQICPPKLSPTAYLDGMRGLAALFVFFCHYLYQGFTIAKGWGCEDDNYDFFKLPFFRLWYQGPQAVCVFFVISGYALSYRPLKLIRSHSVSEFSSTMSSLTFRRGLRLYVPTAVSTFMIVCLLRLGAYEWTRDFANDETYMPNVIEPHPLRMESAYEQFSDWALHMYRFVHIFGWEKFGGSTSYDVHLWTIPVEFRCSLYLFLVILATARLRTRFRLLVVGFATWFAYRHSRWDLMLFLCGTLLAEWDIMRGAHVSPPALPQDEKSAQGASRSLWKRAFWILTSILGVYLLCQPDDGGETTPGWRTLTAMIPEWWTEEHYRYWQSIGAVVFVAAVGHSRGWQRFFSLPVMQYLGKISYALYLMHGPAMHTVGYHFEKMAYSITGVEGDWYTIGFALHACFCVPIVIWWADVFWRAVDIPSVKFAKWVESKCTDKI